MEEFGAKTFYLTFMPGKAEIINAAAQQSGTPGFSGTPGGPGGFGTPGFTP